MSVSLSAVMVTGMVPCYSGPVDLSTTLSHTSMVSSIVAIMMGCTRMTALSASLAASHNPRPAMFSPLSVSHD